jgi:hypothetical protein
MFFAWPLVVRQRLVILSEPDDWMMRILFTQWLCETIQHKIKKQYLIGTH